MTSLVATAFLLGIVFNATPGPVFAETVRQGVRGGFRAAFAVQAGSLVGDALWAIVGLIGVGLLSEIEALRMPIGFAGAAYLLWLAWSAWHSSRAPIHSTAHDITAPRRAMRSGIVLSLTNPQNVAYWAAIGSALRGIGITEPTIGDNLVFFTVFMTSSTIWAVTVSSLIDRVFRRAGDGWTRLTYRACAIALLALALALLRELANSIHLGTWHQAPGT